MESTISTGLIGAVAGAALVAALAFRHLVGTVIKLNQELQDAIDDRRASDQAHQDLTGKVTQLEFQVASLQARLEDQFLEIQHLQTQLSERDRLISNLQTS